MNFIEGFFSYTYESSINKKMLYYDYEMPIEEIREYVNNIIRIPIEDLLKYILVSVKEEQIFPKDVFQFSDFQDATYRICKELKYIGNPGVSFLEAGKLLLNDGKERKDTAFVKYGENHLKTAAALGLIYELANTYFLSSIGYIVDEFSKEEKNKLLVRLVLRNKLIRQLLIASQNGIVDVRQFLYMLSDSTYVRRRSNLKCMLKILDQSEEYDFQEYINRMRIR